MCAVQLKGKVEVWWWGGGGLAQMQMQPTTSHDPAVEYRHILRVSAQNFTHLSGCADFSRPFIWSRVSGLMRFHDGSDKGTTSNFV
jgi:hypothetical protein